MLSVSHDLYPWLTKGLLLKVLKTSEDNDTIQVINYELHDAVAKGENYTSHMIRVSVTFNHRNSNGAKQKTFIVKTTLGAEINDTFEKVAFFKKEITFYRDLIPRSVKYINQIEPNYAFSPRCFEVNDHPTYFIFEDLNAKGFRNIDRRRGLNFKTSTLVLKQLAKYHAMSAMLCCDQPELCEVFKIKVVDREAPDMMNVFLCGIRDCQELARNWSGYEHLSPKLERLCKVLIAKIEIGFERDTSEFNLITHGDLWINNIMFKFDEENQPIDLIMIDFQLGFFGSPAIDLSHFLFTSTANDIKEAEWDRLLKIYYDELVESLKAVNYPKHIPSFTDIQIQMLKRSLYAVMMALLILIPRHIESSDQANLGVFSFDDVKMKKLRHKLYDKPEVKERILYLLDYFDRKGFLES